jgi:hypothetical protein
LSDETDVLLGLIDQENARVIHYQEERTNTTNIIFVVAGAIVAVLSIDQKICGNNDAILSFILIPLGLLGIFLNIKYHERVYYHELLRGIYSDQLNRLLPDVSLRNAKQKVKTIYSKQSKFFRLFYKSTLWKTWVMVNLITVVFGIVLLFVSFTNVCK